MTAGREPSDTLQETRELADEWLGSSAHALAEQTISLLSRLQEQEQRLSTLDRIKEERDNWHASNYAERQARLRAEAHVAALQASLVSRTAYLEAAETRIAALQAELEAKQEANAQLTKALEQIANPHVGPTGFLGKGHGGTGFPNEIARVALADAGGSAPHPRLRTREVAPNDYWTTGDCQVCFRCARNEAATAPGGAAART